MLAIFWDSQGPIPETYLKRGTILKSATYCDMLQRGLKPTIRPKIGEDCQRGSCCRMIMPISILRLTLEAPRKLKWEVTEHADHSQNLVPSDVHLLDLLKEL
jgi:hypothetical protein